MTHSMPTSLESSLHVMQTEFANPQFPIRNSTVLLRKGRLIPRLDLKLSESNRRDLGNGRTASWTSGSWRSGVEARGSAGGGGGWETGLSDCGDGAVEERER